MTWSRDALRRVLYNRSFFIIKNYVFYNLFLQIMNSNLLDDIFKYNFFINYCNYNDFQIFDIIFDIIATHFQYYYYAIL